MKGTVLTCLLSISMGLKFVMPDADLQKMNMDTESYAESLKKAARIDYFQGTDKQCVHTGSTWRATYTLEKSGLKKGGTAKVGECYRVERWWVNHNDGDVSGKPSSDGELRGMSELKSTKFKGTEEVGGIKFSCAGDKLVSNFFTTDNCGITFKNEAGDAVTNRHVSAAGIVGNWDGCNRDLDKTDTELVYKASGLEYLKDFTEKVQALTTAAWAVRTGQRAATITEDGTTGVISLVKDINDISTGGTTMIKFTEALARGGIGAEKIGLYVPSQLRGDFGFYAGAGGGALSTDEAAGEPTVKDTGAGNTLEDIRRHFNFKPPICVA